ncbi:hypothetical protein BaRGS_00002154 [Batillaria attramentaria]|uniref:Uncharacterized protein n=1 Tax=Batillaria attramentaria TaxID=370345 RepID=A0ABD0M5K2_9CAEN
MGGFGGRDLILAQPPAFVTVAATGTRSSSPWWHTGLTGERVTDEHFTETHASGNDVYTVPYPGTRTHKKNHWAYRQVYLNLLQNNSPSADQSPEPGRARDAAVKLAKWNAVQDEILSMMREGSKSDSSLTLHHAPQVTHTLDCSSAITCMTHFTCTTGEMFTCQASSSSREHHTLAWKLAADNTLKPYRFSCPIRITELIFIPKCRVYVGYSPTKVLRVFMDPETGCQEVFTITCVSKLTCMAYNKETEEIIAGAKGFVETWKVSGQENVNQQYLLTMSCRLFHTHPIRSCPLACNTPPIPRRLAIKAVPLGARLSSEVGRPELPRQIVSAGRTRQPSQPEVKELKVDYKNSQLLVVSEKGMCVINYKVWNSVVYTQVHEFVGHSEPITAVQGHRKDPLLFSAATDGTFHVWRMDSFQKYMSLDLGSKIMNVKMLSDSTLFCQTESDVRLYSLNQFHKLFTPLDSAIVKLQRIRCFGEHPNRILVSTEDGFVQMLSPVTGNTITSMSPLPDNQTLSTFVYNSKERSLYTILQDGEVVVLNAARNPMRASELLQPANDSKKVLALAVMKVKVPSGETEDEDTLIFMGMKNGQSYNIIMESPVDAHQGAITCLTSSADVDKGMMGLMPVSHFLVSGGMDNFVNIWALEFEPDEEGAWNVKLVSVQKIDCVGTPSHIAMFDNVICVTIGAYGLVKMFRLGGLRADLQNQSAMAIAVALTHNNVYDHTDEVVSLDMCPMVGLFVTCSKDGFVKVWDLDNQPIKEMNFSRAIHGVCFANNRGDILVGLHNRIIVVPITNYLPPDYLERLAQKMFKDEDQERRIIYKPHKNRRKHWFDRKSIPKFSTDLQKRISEKVEIHTQLIGMMDSEHPALERMNTDMSLLTETSALSDLETDAEPLTTSQEPSKLSSQAVKEQERKDSDKPFNKMERFQQDRRPANKVQNRRRGRGNLQRGSIGKLHACYTLLCEGLEELEAERVKTLPQWEQFLLTRKPIIALDGYIPNSVVRATIGYVKPKSPEPVWRLKPVPKANHKHLPEGWTFKDDEETAKKKKVPREDSVMDEFSDIESVMSLKREATLQNIKQQQSIKEASMFIGTIYCLLPDGTEPESVPNFTWRSAKEDVADLTATVRLKVLSPVLKRTTVITAVPQKQVQKDENKPPPPATSMYKTTKMVAPKVSIDLTANMDMRIASQPQPRAEVAAPKREKSMSFRLPTAGTASATLIEEPDEESSPPQTEKQEDGTRNMVSQDRQRERSFDRGQPPGRRPPRTRSGKAPPLRRELTGEELGLLQRIVREDWFPKHVPCAFEPVMDALLAFVDKGDAAVYAKVCDYIVAIAKEIGIPRQYLNKCGDKLTKQTSHYAAMIRKKSLWTLRQLGISRKELISAILPSLADAKADIREEAIAALNDLMGDQSQEGLSNLMTSLGMSSKPITTKEERQAALKMISERLASDKKVKLPGGGSMQDKVHMWVSSLTTADPSSAYEMKNAQFRRYCKQASFFTPVTSIRAVVAYSDEVGTDCLDPGEDSEQQHDDGDQSPVYCLLEDYGHADNGDQPQIARHLEQKHSEESDVAYALSLPKKSKARRDKWLEIRNKGNFHHNQRVLKDGKGSIIPSKRPRSDDTSDAHKYVPCAHCFGMFRSSALWRHSKTCKFKAHDTSEKDHQRQGKALLPVSDSISEPYKRDILDSLAADKVSQVVKNDKVINSFGQKLYARCSRHPHLRQYVKQKLRELGRFLICVGENSGVHSLQDCISAKHFKLVCDAVKKVSRFHDGSYKTPSLALKLGHTLAKCARIVHSNAVRADDAGLKKDAKDFLALYHDDWNDEVSTTALQDLHFARFNNAKRLPLAKDLQKLNAHLQEKAAETMAAISQDAVRDPAMLEKNCRELNRITLAQVVLFNRRRAGETERMEVCQYQQGLVTGKQVQEDIFEGLSQFEKHLVHTLARIEIRGKRGRKVPVLLTEQLKAQIECLLLHRGEAGVHPDNPFLFPRGGDALTAIRSSDLEAGNISKYTGKCLDEIDVTVDEAIPVEETCGAENLQAEETSATAGTLTESSPTSETQKTAPSVKAARKSGPRQKWSSDEKEAVARQLGKYFRIGRLPGKNECEEAKRNEPVLHRRSWAQAIKLNARWDAPPGSKAGSRGSIGSDLYGDDITGDREQLAHDKSSRSDHRQLKSSQTRKSFSRKSGKQDTGTSDSPVNQSASQTGHLKPGAVEQGTGMTPVGKKGPPYGSTRTEDEQYLLKHYEHYGSDYGEEDDIYQDRSQFTAIDIDFTPNMFRSETGESSMSEDLPSLVKLDSSRPRGASIQKYYERQEQVTQTTTAGPNAIPSSRRRGKWQQGSRPGEEHDSHYLSLGYDTDNDVNTHRTLDAATDISSMADSGIVQDMSDTSSNVRSLYKQGQPGLSPIRSITQMGGPGKEPDWRDFLETAAAIERKRVEKVKKEAKEAKEARGRKGKRGSGDSLPPITYMNDAQPKQQGEAGMRCLHTIRVVDKEKADSEKTKIEAVPGRLTTHTQEQNAGETSYGLLQMQWSTNVPALPIMPETRGQPLIPKDIMQPWEPNALPRFNELGMWTQPNADSLMNELQKKLPNMRSDRGQNFQWKRPIPPAKLSDMEPLMEREEHECEHLRLARKKMHHFTSGLSKSLHLPKVSEGSQKKESTQQLLSMIRQSSMSLLPPAPLKDIIRHITVNTEVNVA